MCYKKLFSAFSSRRHFSLYSHFKIQAQFLLLSTQISSFFVIVVFNSVCLGFVCPAEAILSPRKPLSSHPPCQHPSSLLIAGPPSHLPTLDAGAFQIQQESLSPQRSVSKGSPCPAHAVPDPSEPSSQGGHGAGPSTRQVLSQVGPLSTPRPHSLPR